MILSILTILAIIIGPIAAVQVHKWREGDLAKKGRKLDVFKSLMATRGSRVSFEHVRALNMIDIEFKDEEKITDAWKCYLDSLADLTEDANEDELKRWDDRKNDLFTALLSEIAKSLGYHFDSVHLKKGVYVPQAHGQEELYQYFIRDAIEKVFSGKKAIPISVAQPQEALKKQDDLQTYLTECLSGKRAIRVKLESQEDRPVPSGK